MQEVLVLSTLYIIGVILTLSIITTLFQTDILMHVLNLWFNHEDGALFKTSIEAENYLIINGGLFGKLISCPICLSHWLGLFIAILAQIVAICNGYLDSFGLVFPLLCMFTYPFWVSKSL